MIWKGEPASLFVLEGVPVDQIINPLILEDDLI